MQRVAAKFVPRLLTDEQKQKRLEVSQEHFDPANTDENFMKNTVTGDEAWIYGCDVETKARFSQCS
jgi:hypothetical protein